MGSGKRFTLILVIAMSAILTQGFAQSVVEATAVAEVVDVLKATEVNSLNFGKFTPEEEGGEITITPNGVRISRGTVILGSGEYNAASFRLYGEPEAVVSLVLPQTSTALINTVTGKQMLVDNWTTNELVNNMMSLVLTNGSVTLNIGATLRVGTIEDNPVGRYSGKYEITFTYN
jgi:hypothetical protein